MSQMLLFCYSGSYLNWTKVHSTYSQMLYVYQAVFTVCQFNIAQLKLLNWTADYSMCLHWDIQLIQSCGGVQWGWNITPGTRHINLSGVPRKPQQTKRNSSVCRKARARSIQIVFGQAGQGQTRFGITNTGCWQEIRGVFFCKRVHKAERVS